MSNDYGYYEVYYHLDVFYLLVVSHDYNYLRLIVVHCNKAQNQLRSVMYGLGSCIGLDGQG